MEKLISEFSFGLFFWQLFIFVGLVLLLKKYAWKPILDTVNARETSIKEALGAAADARKEMASLQEDNQRILKEARAEREALLKEARTTGAQLVEQAKADAQKEADRILTQAQAAIQTEKAAEKVKRHTQLWERRIQRIERKQGIDPQESKTRGKY